MKCQLCKKRIGKYTRFLDWLGRELLLCKKCRIAECPTPEEALAEDLREEHRAEFQAELGAGCFDLP